MTVSVVVVPIDDPKNYILYPILAEKLPQEYLKEQKTKNTFHFRKYIVNYLQEKIHEKAELERF